MTKAEEKQKIEFFCNTLGNNWGYSPQITPLAIFEDYLIKYIPIITPTKDFDIRDYLYVKNALVQQEKEAKLLKLYREAYGVIEAWNTLPQVHKQIAELEGELGDLK